MENAYGLLRITGIHPPLHCRGKQFTKNFTNIDHKVFDLPNGLFCVLCEKKSIYYKCQKKYLKDSNNYWLD